MADPDRVGQRDHQGPLDAVERPAFPWQQHREALRGRREESEDQMEVRQEVRGREDDGKPG